MNMDSDVSFSTNHVLDDFSHLHKISLAFATKIKACFLGIHDGLRGRLDRGFSEHISGKFSESRIGGEQTR